MTYTRLTALTDDMFERLSLLTCICLAFYILAANMKSYSRFDACRLFDTTSEVMRDIPFVGTFRQVLSGVCTSTLSTNGMEDIGP